MGSVRFTLENGQVYEFEKPVPPEISAAIGSMLGHGKSLREIPERITLEVDGVGQLTVAATKRLKKALAAAAAA